MPTAGVVVVGVGSREEGTRVHEEGFEFWIKLVSVLPHI
jgi:hypothetical protein